MKMMENVLVLSDDKELIIDYPDTLTQEDFDACIEFMKLVKRVMRRRVVGKPTVQNYGGPESKLALQRHDVTLMDGVYVCKNCGLHFDRPNNWSWCSPPPKDTGSDVTPEAIHTVKDDSPVVVSNAPIQAEAMGVLDMDLLDAEITEALINHTQEHPGIVTYPAHDWVPSERWDINYYCSRCKCTVDVNADVLPDGPCVVKQD